MRTTLAAVLLASVSLVACGGGDDDDPVTPVIDAPIGGPDAPAANCTATASFGDKGALTGQAFFASESGDPPDDGAKDDVNEFVAPLETGEPFDGIDVLLYAGYGVFKPSAANPNGVIQPGTYTISGEELTFDTCGVCVFLVTDITQAGYADDYMAMSGTVEVTGAATAVGQTVSGRLTNITFRHVTVGDGGVTTDVNDGCSSQLENATYTASAMMPTMRSASTPGPLGPKPLPARLRR
jgi:hypothetical protein